MVNRGAGCHPANVSGLPIRPTKILFFLLSTIVLASCSPGTPPSTPQIIPVYSTSAAEPWLTELYACAADHSSIVLSRVEDSASAEIALRIGEPEFLATFAYQIDQENVIVVMNNARPPLVNTQQIKEIFMGRITNLNEITSQWGKAHTNESGDIHVWVFSSDSDIQQVFDVFVLEGRPVVSTARVVITPQEMLDKIQSDVSAIGVLSQSWNPDNKVFEQAVIATVPVLALTQSEPQGVINQLIGCLQSN